MKNTLFSVHTQRPMLQTSSAESQEASWRVPGRSDKLNSVDFRWFVVRSQPHQERLLARLLHEWQSHTSNILEVYCPEHSTVRTVRNGRESVAPLLAGFVFVLATHAALSDFLARQYPGGSIVYGRRMSPDVKASPLTVPECQMRFFMDFNATYADRVLVLERPFSDYAFNPKTGEPNDMVRVLEGPLAGREGYLTRYRRGRRLVFNMASPSGRGSFAVSVPFDWSLRVVRLHEPTDTRVGAATADARAVDLLVGLIQSNCPGEVTLHMLLHIINILIERPSLTGLCSQLAANGHKPLAANIMKLDPDAAALIMGLVRREHDAPGYIQSRFGKCAVRPFLTPTAGISLAPGTDEATVSHGSITEIIRCVAVTEPVGSGSGCESASITTDYYAHLYQLPESADGLTTLIANWDTFLGEYFLTAGHANERLVDGTVHASGTDAGHLMESFRNFAPTLHRVLIGADPQVHAVREQYVGDFTINGFAVTSTDVATATATLLTTCMSICTEISSGVRLAVWRRYLRTVWLHI